MTLARYFIKLRNDAKMSMRELAQRVKPHPLDASTVWKIEQGRPVRAKTLGQILRALGYSERDEEYVKAFALWSTEQAKTLAGHRVETGIDRVRRTNDRAFDRVLERVAAALRKMPEEDWPGVVEAVEQPEALKHWLQSTHFARK